jgi:hypothetical protein
MDLILHTVEPKIGGYLAKAGLCIGVCQVDCSVVKPSATYAFYHSHQSQLTLRELN